MIGLSFFSDFLEEDPKPKSKLSLKTDCSVVVVGGGVVVVVDLEVVLIVVDVVVTGFLVVVVVDNSGWNNEIGIAELTGPCVNDVCGEFLEVK